MTAQIQDPATGRWYPYTPENDNGRGNILIDGQVYSHDAGLAKMQQQPATPESPTPENPGVPGKPEASPDRPTSESQSPSYPYYFEGYDGDGRSVYRGSDGLLYTDDPNAMNGMGRYGGPGDALAQTPGGPLVTGGRFTPDGQWQAPEVGPGPSTPGPNVTPPPTAGGGGGGVGGGAAAAGGGGGGAGSYGPNVAPGPGGLDPWSKAFNPSADATLDIGEAPLFDAPEWQAPTWTDRPADFVAPEWQAPEAFHAPKGEEVYQDEGYQFRADQGQQRLAASAAAQGLLRSGGTLKDILGYGQSLASQEYGDVYNRRVNEYGQAYNAAMDAYKNKYGAAVDEYSKGYGAAKDKFEADYAAKRDEYDRLFNAKTAEYAPKLQAWTSKKTEKQNAYDRDWKQYLQSWDEFNTDRNFKLRALGG